MSQKKSPFKFLDSYQQSDADVFFGREKETEDLYNALSGVKHLMVYGPSGSGKTSLVECGLRNQFSDADWFALTIRKGADINTSVFAAINEALHEKIAIDPATKMPEDPQMEFGQAVEQLFTERYQPVYLLFDQFEELLISGGSEEKKKFFTLLNKLIRNKVPCRMMLIMREEFIGHLSEFEPVCPSIFQHRFRVEKMERKNVEEVIYHILEAPRYQSFFKVDDSRKLAESILSKLPDKKKEIELSHVQVFLGELWDRAQTSNEKNALPLLSEDLIQKEDNLEAVLESFLKKQMRDLEKRYGESAPLELLATMITERFTKLQLSEVAIKADLEHKKVTFKKPIADLLKDLELRRIIRSVKIGDEAQYEISHDVLALVVGQNLTEEMKMREKAGDIYKVYQERQGLFSQDDIDYLRPFQQSLSYPPDLQRRIDNSIAAIKQKDEEEKVKAKKRLRTLYSLLGAAIIALIFGGYFYLEALEQTKFAKEQTKIAMDSSLSAQKQRQIALDKTRIALDSSKSAQEQRENALNALKKAEESDSLAQIEKNNAIKQAATSRALLLNNTAKDLLSKGMKTQALRVAEVAYKTISDVNTHSPTPLLSSLSNSFYSDLPIELAKINHTDPVISVAFSPDGQYILTGSADNTATLWDLKGNKIQAFQGHADTNIYLGVTSVAFSPDGQSILTGSWDYTAILWDLKGNKIQTFEGHNQAVECVAFSPDGQTILTGSYDKTAILWDLKGNPIGKPLQGHTNIVSSVAFSPDGQSVLTGSGGNTFWGVYDNTAILWDLKGNQIGKPFQGHTGPVNSVAFSSDGLFILTGSSDSTAILWDLKGNPIGKPFQGHTGIVNSVAFSNDGQSILTGSSDQTAIHWDLKGNVIGEPFQGHNGYINSVAFSPDEQSILTGSEDKTAILWDLKGNKIQAFQGHADTNIYQGVNSVAFSPDGQSILTASDYNNIAILWDLKGNQIQTFQGHTNGVTSVAFSPDGQAILTGGFDGTILWDLNGTKIQTFRGPTGYSTCVAFSPDGQSILTSADNTAILWDLKGNIIGNTIKVKISEYNISGAFSPDGQSILTSADYTAILWDLKGTEIQTFHGHTNDVNSVTFSPDGKSILTGSNDKSAILWDLNGNIIGKPFQGHTDGVFSVAFSPDGQAILTGSWDNTAILWDLKGTKIHTFQGHTAWVNSVAISPDGQTIITGSSDNSAILWKTPKGIYEWLQSPECRIRQLTEKEKIEYGIIVEGEY